MAPSRPNLLLITADDMGGDTPGAFGGPPGVTPTLDALAADGMSFRRAHVAIAICQPSRSAMMTGKYPHRNGAEGFQPINDGVPILTELLKAADYRTGIVGKVEHLEPFERFGWDVVGDRETVGMGRDAAGYKAHAAQLIADAAAADQPWFLMANAHDPHRPFHGSPDERQRFTEEQRRGIPAPSKVYGAADAVVPGFLPDLPEVRQEIAEYLSSSRRCDDVVAAVLSAVDAAGQADNTVVVFLSDNGMAFPFAKSNCYLQSTRTPLIVRWPGRTRPGSVDDTHFVSSLDLFPTFCAAAGVQAPDDIDGMALTELLDGRPEGERDRIFTVFHENHAKLRFEMRCVQDDTYGYIWNAWSDGAATYGRVDNMAGRTWRAMKDAADRDESIAARVDFYVHRSPDELYDLRADPHALHNLADDPEHHGVLTAMRERLGDWMATVDDPLAGKFELQFGRQAAAEA